MPAHPAGMTNTANSAANDPQPSRGAPVIRGRISRLRPIANATRPLPFGPVSIQHGRVTVHLDHEGFHFLDAGQGPLPPFKINNKATIHPGHVGKGHAAQPVTGQKFGNSREGVLMCFHEP